MKTIFKVILKSLNNVSRREHNWEKYFIGLLHVSEHVDHFKAIKYFCEKKQEIVWSGGTPPLFGKIPNYFLFFFEGFPKQKFMFFILRDF